MTQTKFTEHKSSIKKTYNYLHMLVHKINLLQQPQQQILKFLIGEQVASSGF